MAEEAELSKEYLELYEVYRIPLGVVSSFISVVLLALNIVTLVGIRNRNECVKYPAFRIMSLSIVFDSVQLFVHITSAIFGACGQQIPSRLNTVLGAVISAAWMTSNSLTVLLSFNRVLVVAHTNMERRIFKGWREHAILFLFAMIFPAYAAFQFGPYSRFIYYYIDLEWNYDFRLPYAKLFFEIDHFSIVVLLLFFTLCYARIFHKLLTQNSKNSLERKLTINVFIYGLYFAFLFVYWEFIDGQLLETTPVSNFLSNMMWIVANGMQAILTLILNRGVRKVGAETVLAWILRLAKCQLIREKGRPTPFHMKALTVAPPTTSTALKKGK
ncbi:hypothetical protein Y032_0041g450 [Ancylostoma ceylanicum]|uniref:7TM GPCR serpentine receptor class x (Srx) domain-containing protein n=1 Tax=Ancylostoma ceylanicum TaxID=53326 RepID=A0A016UG17_9BILA|nr:hypothetical protein Y032_0041g450 [Ancylostoma ceylanicum]